MHEFEHHLYAEPLRDASCIPHACFFWGEKCSVLPKVFKSFVHHYFSYSVWDSHFFYCQAVMKPYYIFETLIQAKELAPSTSSVKSTLYSWRSGSSLSQVRKIFKTHCSLSIPRFNETWGTHWVLQCLYSNLSDISSKIMFNFNFNI